MSSINKVLVNRTITLALQDGTNASGTTVIKNRTFNCINPEATEEDMHNTATQLGSLMKNTVGSVYFSEKSLLEEVE